ncbi:hypothetical protein [Neorhodopirellula pilleata]|uniref:Uncharacterized protein n=1 Tax=Neorhodopirellula pilleata TaxID=2714738 RepID=A0A5C6A7T2_9BACT|nr:hypothetical protein [Neorhodopirellula pilleata]TWT95506.1 hypothetical protein Pla100_31470 [Neorhodopirellula pilleata]
MKSLVPDEVPSVVFGRTAVGTAGRWLIGLIVGTLLIAVTSPWFVRTYASRTWDPVRQQYVYPEHLTYRWRAEGYAASHIGPHGIVGRAELPSDDHPRIALWGDSQAEGVTLPDDAKLWAVLQGIHPDKQFLPLAQSGDDASDWVRGIQHVEDKLQIAEHWILVCELQDLAVLKSPTASPENLSAKQSPWLDYVPDFVVEAGRGLLLDSENQPRHFRFSIGPTAEAFQADIDESVSQSRGDAFWAEVAARLAESTSLPITVIYAPKLPVIWSDAVIDEDFDADDFRRLQPHLHRRDIAVVDCRDAFRQSAARGEFPHGFHNGRFGWGHLNEVGNRLIAETTSAEAMIAQESIR